MRDVLSAHDSGAARLRLALHRFCEEQGGCSWFLVPGTDRVRWRLPSAPDGYVVPDLMFFAAGDAERIEWGCEFTEVPTDVVPSAIIEVVEQGTLEADFYLKPEWYREAGVREYCVYDRTEEVIRPYFQGWRLRDGVYRRMRTTSYGEMFSTLGFSLSLLFHDPVVQRCDAAELEEELSYCEWLLDDARTRFGIEKSKLDELSAKHERLMRLLEQSRK